MKVRDVFRDQVLMLRLHEEGWILSLRSPNGNEDLFRLYRTRAEALDAIDVWTEAMGDDTELDVPASALGELRRLILETLRRMAAGEMAHGPTGRDYARSEDWLKQMGE